MCELPPVNGIGRLLEANEMVVRMKRETIAEIARKGETDINLKNHFMFKFDGMPKSLMGFVDNYIESNKDCIIQENYFEDCKYYVERAVEKWSGE